LLRRCLEIDPLKRITAREALDHEFLRSSTKAASPGKPVAASDDAAAAPSAGASLGTTATATATATAIATATATATAPDATAAAAAAAPTAPPAASASSGAAPVAEITAAAGAFAEADHSTRERHPPGDDKSAPPTAPSDSAKRHISEDEPARDKKDSIGARSSELGDGEKRNPYLTASSCVAPKAQRLESEGSS
jgi:hypothetical protein